MTRTPQNPEPAYAEARRAIKTITCYPVEQLPPFDLTFYERVRPSDFIEFFTESDLLDAVSACPGGDCGTKHWSDQVQCYPLKIKIYMPADDALKNWQPSCINAYSRTHGLS